MSEEVVGTAAPAAEAPVTPTTPQAPNVPDLNEYVETTFDNLNAVNRQKYGIDADPNSDGGGEPSDEVRDTVKSLTDITEDQSAAPEGEQEAEAETDPAEGGEEADLIKVNGREIDISKLSKSERVSLIQKGFGADEKFKQAADARSQMETILKQLQTNPMEILKHPSLGIGEEKLREMMENELGEKYKYESMSDEEKEYHDNFQKLKGYEQEKAQREDNEISAQKEAMKVDARERFSADIMEAITESGITPSPFVVKQTAKYMLEARQRKFNLSAKDVIGLVTEDIQNYMRQYVGSLAPEKITEVLGADAAKALRQAELGKVKTRGKLPTTPERQGKGRSNPRKKTMSVDEWRDRNEKIKLGLA